MVRSDDALFGFEMCQALAPRGSVSIPASIFSCFRDPKQIRAMSEVWGDLTVKIIRGVNLQVRKPGQHFSNISRLCAYALYVVDKASGACTECLLFFFSVCDFRCVYSRSLYVDDSVIFFASSLLCDESSAPSYACFLVLGAPQRTRLRCDHGPMPGQAIQPTVCN